MVLLVSVALSACAFRDRNRELPFTKPPEPVGLSVFVEDLPKIATSTFAADYTVTGDPYTNGARLSLAPPRGRLDTSLAGVQIAAFFTLAPVSATVCASTGGVSVGCRPLGSADMSVTTALLSPKVQGELVSLFLVPGARITEERMLDQDAICMDTPATGISPEIRVCIAKSGGLLFYSNGTTTIQALSYTNTVSQASLVPPSGAAAAGSGL